MSKEELRQRIVRGHVNVDRITELAGRLPHGKKRDEIGGKALYMLGKLHELEDGFIELYPSECLFVELRCSNQNKGCFPCASCPKYLNAVWGSQKQEILFT